MSETTRTDEAIPDGSARPAENMAPAEAPEQSEQRKPIEPIEPVKPLEQTEGTEEDALASAESTMVAEGGTPSMETAESGEGSAQAEGADSTDPTGSTEPAERTQGPPNLSPAACAALLAQHFPALFGAGRALPLKLRIQGDIQQRVPGLFNKKSLSIFLHRYTTSTAYLKALGSAPQRLDLDGAPAGEIDAVHREAANVEVQRRKQMFEERRAAEREQQRLAAQEARRAQATQNAARQTARDHSRDNAEAEARRNRAAVLRAFETTTLTRANFCALKGLVEAELDAQLALARQEREQRAQEPRFEPRQDRPRGDRPPQQPPRGPRPDRPAQQRPRHADRNGPQAGPRPAGKPPAKPES